MALFQTFRDLLDDPEPLLPVLRQIAAHERARQMLAAHGHDIDRILRSCEDHIASWGVREPDEYDDAPEGDGDGPPAGDGCFRECPTEISFTSDGLHVCVEFGVSNGLADVTVFAAPNDEDAAPGMSVLHFAPPPEQARAIGRALLALADAAERGGDAP